MHDLLLLLSQDKFDKTFQLHQSTKTSFASFICFFHETATSANGKLGEHLKRQCQLHVWWVSRLGFQRRKKIKFKVQSLPSNLRDKQCVKLSLRWASAVKNHYYPGLELHRHKLDILMCHSLNFLNKKLSLLINAINNDFQINVTYF